MYNNSPIQDNVDGLSTISTNANEKKAIYIFLFIARVFISGIIFMAYVHIIGTDNLIFLVLFISLLCLWVYQDKLLLKNE